MAGRMVIADSIAGTFQIWGWFGDGIASDVFSNLVNSLPIRPVLVEAECVFARSSHRQGQLLQRSELPNAHLQVCQRRQLMVASEQIGLVAPTGLA